MTIRLWFFQDNYSTFSHVPNSQIFLGFWSQDSKLCENHWEEISVWTSFPNGMRDRKFLELQSKDNLFDFSITLTYT